MKIYILSGGKSSRMGEDKGLKLLNGKPLISYLLNQIETLDIEIKIVANIPLYDQFGFQTIPDKIKEKGPLGGIFSALSDANQDVLILSADTPVISKKIIMKLIHQKKENQINIISYNDKIQPLCGIYPIKLLSQIEEKIKNDELKMMNLLQEFPTNYIKIEGEKPAFINVNTPEDFKFIESILN